MSPRWRGTVSGKVTNQVFVMGREIMNGALASDLPKRGCVMSEEFDEGRFRAQVGVFLFFLGSCSCSPESTLHLQVLVHD